MLAWAVRVEGISPARLGIRRPTLASFGIAVACAVVVIVLFALCYSVVFPAFGVAAVPTRLATIAQEPLWLTLLITLRAGIVEEFLFRFYPIGRLATATGSIALAVIVPGLVFIGLHAGGWGVMHLVPVTLATIVFTLLYLWKRDFWCSALAHFLVDFITFAAAHAAAGHAG